MLKRGFKEMLAEANAVIETVSVADLDYLLDDPEVVLVDVRETVERERLGAIPGSVHAPRGLLEFHADPESPAYNGESARFEDHSLLRHRRALGARGENLDRHGLFRRRVARRRV